MNMPPTQTPTADDRAATRHKTANVSIYLTFIFLVFLLSACGKEEGSLASCVPGQTVSCACPAGALGVQACTDDGRYGSCECGDASHQNDTFDDGDTGQVFDTGDAGLDDVAPTERNACNGRDDLLLDGSPAEPGEACGACGDGLIICDGPNTLRCLGAAALNPCGGCGPFEGEPMESCGTCGQGVYTCGDDGTLACVGDGAPNACGGCSELDGEPLFVCFDSLGMQGIWHCTSREQTLCVTPGKNACGGNQPLSANPWTPCGACSEGIYACDGPDAVVCTEERLNACGGCDVLPGQPGQSCGACGEVWECSAQGLLCQAKLNACGGCSPLAEELGGSCGEGEHYVCEGTESLRCISNEVNLCGGHVVLEDSPGTSCGPCGDGQRICTSLNRVACVGASETNACGGCEGLTQKLNAPCGVCFDGTLQCQGNDPNRLACVGDDETIDLNSDENHCGFCGNRCVAAHGRAQCVQGQCQVESAFPVMVAGGRQHTCALPGDGRVYCWGSNNFGAVTGQAVFVNYHAPVRVGALEDIVQIVAGDHHSCARTSAGRVICWGQATNFRLGPGTSGTNPTFAPITGLNDVVDLDAGSAHSCAVEAGGKVRCWGVNTNARLGTGNATSISDLSTVIEIDSAVAITTGSDHSCARLASGTVRCWGANGNGQLGNGASTATQAVPVEPTNLGAVRDISAGTQFTCAVREGNTVSCWGANGSRQLGRGDISNSLFPVAVTGVNSAQNVATGATHACVVRTDGTARCWGSGARGELGHGEFLATEFNGGTGSSASPVTPAGLAGITGLGLGYQFSCAATVLAKIHCWGANEQGQLGDNQLSGQPPASRRRPFALPTLGPITNEAGLCADNLDNDQDGKIVCDDGDCASDLGSALAERVAQGTTCDSGNYFLGSCHFTGDSGDMYATNGGEVIYTWTAPETGTYSFGTDGSALRTVLYLLDTNCTGEELACARSEWNTPAQVSRAVNAGDKLVIVVDSLGDYMGGGDGSSHHCGDYELHIARVL